MAKTAFLFPGQGAQAVGMGRSLYDSLPIVRERFDRAAEVVGFDLAKICFEGPKEELDSTVVSQPALFVASLAALDGLQNESPETAKNCSAAAGLSLGEYTALVFAGAIDFEDGLRLVALRGRAMQDASDATPSRMLSILGIDREPLALLCEKAAEGQVIQIANLLCPGNIVVSGNAAACERLGKLAEGAGAMRVIPLAVAGAFHTSLMEPAPERLAAALAEVVIRPPRIPVVSNVDARPHNDPDEIRSLLIKQVVEPVRWEDSMRWLLDTHSTGQFYEIGPGRILRGLLKRIARKTPCENVDA